MSITLYIADENLDEVLSEGYKTIEEVLDEGIEQLKKENPKDYNALIKCQNYQLKHKSTVLFTYQVK